MDQMRLILGDITRLQVDAIVNAANNELRGGGGVDGAIHRAGGPTIMKECRKIGHCATGEAVITGAGELPARYVIHTVGPVWYGGTGNEVELLRSAYTSSLELAADHGLRTIAFPNISTGVYGFPKEKAARIAVDACSEFLTRKTKNMEITFVCYDDVNYQYYAKLLEA